MHSENSRQYEQAVNLAEAGRYEPALQQMLGYLQTSPSDGKALNDAGTILFCMQRGAEAIAYFEKALTLCRGDELTQVYWNLCEACIQEDQPDKAAALFATMHERGILNVDILNRTAEKFLRLNNLGGAVETLLTSLDLSADQDVLRPMLEIIRSHRARITIAADQETPLVHTLRSSLEKRFPAQTLLANDFAALADRMQQSPAFIFAGAGTLLKHGLDLPKSGKIFVVLEEGDLYDPSVSQIRWSAADTVVACASADAIASFRERTRMRNVIQAQAVIEPLSASVHEKKAGKRIAAVGPWTFRHNPMFLLQCFQKLHYLDADMRLYLAGDFQDEGLERYIQTMAQTMDLDSVIFFEGPIKNWNKWLRDKHFIVSTAIDSSAMASVWAAMSGGLKPVVHHFDGSGSMLPGEYLFTLAEDFCRQIQSADYQPAVYHGLARQQFEKHGVAHKLHMMISRIERTAGSAPEAVAQTISPAAAAMPAGALNLTHTVETQPSAPSVSQIAEQALTASRSLQEMMRQSQSMRQSHEPSIQLQTRPQPPVPVQESLMVPQGGLSVESFLDAEPSAVPFARRT